MDFFSAIVFVVGIICFSTVILYFLKRKYNFKEKQEENLHSENEKVLQYKKEVNQYLKKSGKIKDNTDPVEYPYPRVTKVPDAPDNKKPNDIATISKIADFVNVVDEIDKKTRNRE